MATASAAAEPGAASPPGTMNIGIIGLDTFHAAAFTELINGDDPPPGLKGCRIVAAYPQGSLDIESSTKRIPECTKQVRAKGVEIVDSVDALIGKVDAVLLETNDGRRHLEQALPVLKAHKPLFVDKPAAASLVDVVAIYAAADHYGTPVFSASALRFAPETLAVRNGAIGQVLGCDTFSPCPIEPHHPTLFWYGIHGVESLFTVMQPGCRQVRCISSPDTEIVVGEWNDGRLGVFRGTRGGTHDYGGIAFGSKGNRAVGQFPGYEPLVFEIVRFFRTGVPPVSAEETSEIYAFMEAADESKRRDGAAVSLDSVLDAARREAQTKTGW